jgi:lipoate-protein ligase A
VEELTCRLLPFEAADGPTNMATDEVLLRSARKGVATLRFYAWSTPTLSLGYFQSAKLRRTDPLLAPLAFVRRPSGGGALVHHHEVTYALALPAGVWLQSTSWPRRMHEIIVEALAVLGVRARLFEPGEPSTFEGPLCFHHLTQGDVLSAGAKIVGSAQRKQRGAVLQHGGILLAQSAFAPTLPGIRELSGCDVSPIALVEALRKRFAAMTGARLAAQGLTNGEIEELEELKTLKYDNVAWNAKR